MPNSYTTTVQEMPSNYAPAGNEPKTIATFSANNKVDVKRKIVEFKKKYALKNHNGNICNFNQRLELVNNF